jgi:hypothetical protein
MEGAVEVYASAAKHPIVANSRRFRDMTGAKLAAVASQLPLPAAESAHARGQVADPWLVAAGWVEMLATSPVQSGSSVSDSRKAEPGAGGGV